MSLFVHHIALSLCLLSPVKRERASSVEVYYLLLVRRNRNNLRPMQYARRTPMGRIFGI